MAEPIYHWKGMTVGDALAQLQRVERREDADELLRQWVAAARLEEPSLPEDSALQCVRSNIGYMGGYSTVAFQKHLEELFGAVHPFFGPVGGKQEPKTLRETLEMGMSLSESAGRGEAVSEVVFFVTDGPAYCLDCAADLPYEEKEHLRPVRADGAGDDGCGLICECGLRWPPGEEVE